MIQSLKLLLTGKRMYFVSYCCLYKNGEFHGRMVAKLNRIKSGSDFRYIENIIKLDILSTHSVDAENVAITNFKTLWP